MDTKLQQILPRYLLAEEGAAEDLAQHLMDVRAVELKQNPAKTVDRLYVTLSLLESTDGFVQ